ncbi:MAG TPA: hypothetical protein VF508_05445, partial [Pyrinomonadaceae bacterium]
MRGRPLARFAFGLLSLQLFVWCAVEAGAHRPPSFAPSRPHARTGVPYGPQEEGVFESLEQALRTPEKVKRLRVESDGGSGWKHLPPGLGKLVNLEALEMACLESLEDLPAEIGELRKLEELILDNGNGCSMNVSLPRSVGRLENLRVLRLYGALDGRDVG